MNGIEIFNNNEFGAIRAVLVNDEPWFVGKDVCEAFGDTNYRRSLGNIDDCDKRTSQIETAGGMQNMTIINESGLYSLLFQMQPQKAKGVSQNEHPINERIEKLHRFKRWVTAEVLPAIRKTGSYQQRPLSIPQQIQMIAQGYSDLGQQVTEVQAEVTDLKDNMPLYACETEEVSNHVKRKIVDILGGKQSGAYADRNLRSAVFSDIYSQIKREYGLVSSYKSIKRKYLGDVHDFIDTYDLPTALAEQVAAAGVME